MNRRTIVIACMSAILGMSVAVMLLNLTTTQLRAHESETGEGRFPPLLGRYHFASSDSKVFLADSVTGECWSPANGQWQQVAPPILELKP